MLKVHSILLAGAAALMAIGPMSAHAAPATATPAAKHYSTQDTPIGDLLADPAAKAILDKHIEGFSTSPQIGMATGFTLRAIQPMSGDKITEEMLDAIDADFAKIPAK